MAGFHKQLVRRLATGFFGLFSGLFLTSLAFLAVSSEEAQSQTLKGENDMNQIDIVFNDTGKTCTIKLDDSDEARDLISELPLELTLEDFNKTEKIATLPKKLDVKTQPKGFNPEKGDVTYYIPWGNLAIFTRDFRFSENLVHLGTLSGCMENFDQQKTIPVRLEKSKISNAR